MKFATVICFTFIALVMSDDNGDDSDEDPSLTKCQRARKRAIKSKAEMKIIFNCEEDGSYSGLQCFEKSKFCVCYSEDGEPISPMSTKLRNCECLREAEIATSTDPDSFVPACVDDGAYAKKQCHASRGVCWCVDKTGKKISDETTDPVSC